MVARFKAGVERRHGAVPRLRGGRELDRPTGSTDAPVAPEGQRTSEPSTVAAAPSPNRARVVRATGSSSRWSASGPSSGRRPDRSPGPRRGSDPPDASPGVGGPASGRRRGVAEQGRRGVAVDDDQVDAGRRCRGRRPPTPRPTTGRAKYGAPRRPRPASNRPPPRCRKRWGGCAIGRSSQGWSSTWPLATNRSSRPSLSASSAPVPNPVTGRLGGVEAGLRGGVGELAAAEVAVEGVGLVRGSWCGTGRSGRRRRGRRRPRPCSARGAARRRRRRRPRRRRLPRTAGRRGCGTGSWATASLATNRSSLPSPSRSAMARPRPLPSGRPARPRRRRR